MNPANHPGRKILRRLCRLAAQVTGRPRLRMKLEAGPLLEVRLNDQLGRVILRDEEFESELRQAMLAAIKPGMTVLDVGANFGYYSVLFAHSVGPRGRVVAFEPNPAMLHELRHNLALNEFSHVITQPFALSDHEGELEFSCPVPGQEGHGSLRPNASFAVQGTIRVRCRPLDAVCSELQLPAVDVVKVDVEGGELQVFKGATRLFSGPQRPVVFFENAEPMCRAFGHGAADVLSWVAAQRYSLKQIDSGNWVARPIANA